MKNNSRGKYFYFWITCILLVSVLIGRIQVTFADEAFDNNLIKTDINKNSLGGVKVTLYTKKPYKDSVVVNKKGDNQYIILMPETSNSLMTKPSIKAASDVIDNVEVKTQQYQDNVKGYTKIIISTKKPIEIVPQVETLSPTKYEVSEEEYKELINEAFKDKTKTTPKVTKKTSKAPVTIKKPVVTTLKKIKPQKIEPVYAVKKEPAKLSKKTSKKRKKTYETETEKIEPTYAIKKEIQKQTETPEAPEATTTVQTPETTQTPAVQTEPQQEATPSVIPTTTRPVPIEVMPKQTNTINNAMSISALTETIIKNNLYTVLGGLAAIFIMLLLIARKMAKNIKKRKQNFIKHLNDKPVTPVDYTQNVTEEMSWKEKFKAYSQTSPTVLEEESSIESSMPPAGELDETIYKSDLDLAMANENIEELFNKEKFLDDDDFEAQVLDDESFEGEQEYISDDFDEIIKSEGLDQAISAGLNEGASLDEVFGSEEEFNQEYTSENIEEEIFDALLEEEEKQDELIKSEYAIDEDTGFYLIDYEDATAFVGHIEDEIFVLKRFDERIDAKIQARLDERTATSENYMTKVGDFKGLVEVTPEKMNLLIEL